MDAISQTQASTNAVNQILASANEAVMKQAEKLMKLAVTMTVGMEAGKGQNIDVSG
jgi:hypothetical protein